MQKAIAPQTRLSLSVLVLLVKLGTARLISGRLMTVFTSNVLKA
jgi:hypothetical protein